MSASVWISENNIKEWKYQKKPPYGNVYEWVKVPFSEEDLVNVTSCYKKTSSKKADYPKLDFKQGAKLQQARLIGASDAVNRRRGALAPAGVGGGF